MTVPNADYLRAHLEGKTVQFAYDADKENEFAWFNVFEKRGGFLNHTAVDYLVTGEQAPGYEVVLRIKPEETE